MQTRDLYSSTVVTGISSGKEATTVSRGLGFGLWSSSVMLGCSLVVARGQRRS
jgi:hypothetical protein